MSKGRIPHDAFEFYFSLGPERSYEKVAARYGVTKRAVTKHAANEDWQRRLEAVEAEARTKADQKKVEALDAANERHMQALRLVLGRVRQRASRSPLVRRLQKSLPKGVDHDDARLSTRSHGP